MECQNQKDIENIEINETNRKIQRPIITFIDTQEPIQELEQKKESQGEAIAKNIMEMSKLEVPIICIVIGEGSSGGAIAIGIGIKL